MTAKEKTYCIAIYKNGKLYFKPFDVQVKDKEKLEKMCDSLNMQSALTGMKGLKYKVVQSAKVPVKHRGKGL